MTIDSLMKCLEYLSSLDFGDDFGLFIVHVNPLCLLQSGNQTRLLHIVETGFPHT
jgi:hypothetical protein